MLVISRKVKAGKNLVRLTAPGLTEPIWLTVVEIRSGKVRMGIVAPPGVKIWRGELCDAVDAQVEGVAS